MWQPGREPVSSARTPWKESLDYPGAFQAGYMKSFFERINWQKMVPAFELVQSGPNSNGREILAAVASDSTFVVAYTPYGVNFTLDLSNIKMEAPTAKWFNPRNNTFIPIGEAKKDDNVLFTAPADPKAGNDWVLIIDGN